MFLNVSKRFFTPVIGEQLSCQREPGNRFDVHAVAVMKGGVVVEHVTRELSMQFSRHIREGKE